MIEDPKGIFGIDIKKAPSVDEASSFTLISKVFNGLGNKDELHELCFYFTESLEFRYKIHYESRAYGSGAFLQGETCWHLSRQGHGEIFPINLRINLSHCVMILSNLLQALLHSRPPMYTMPIPCKSCNKWRLYRVGG